MPSPYRPRSNARRRSLLLEEHRRRQGEPAAGGSAREPIVKAYRQRALACAAALQDGPRRTRELRALVLDAVTILLRDVYGRFAHEARGIYCLTSSGAAALQRWMPPGAAQDVSNAGTFLLAIRSTTGPPPDHG